VFGLKWGYQPLLVPFDGPNTSFTMLGVVVAPVQVIVVASAIVVSVGLHIWFRRTRYGQAGLAVAENRGAAALRGMNINLFSLGGFAAAGLLGALVGVITGPITYATPELGSTLALGGFVALAIGGEGSFLGGLFGGLLVGLVSAFATRYIGANYDNVSVLILLLITLAIRPRGLGGMAEVRHV
jgi:branched-chain amino acid transport system permease protein